MKIDIKMFHKVAKIKNYLNRFYFFLHPFFRVKIKPIYSCTSMLAYSNFLISHKYQQIEKKIQWIKNVNNKEVYFIEGFCDLCKKQTSFHVDMLFGGQVKNNQYIPNFRERVVCPTCNLNSRQRLVASLADQISKNKKVKIYLMEQASYFFRFCFIHLKNANVIGSEYISSDHKSGLTYDGIRHENCEMLSFIDDSIDLIISNDVFEHIASPEVAFKEVFRTLKKNGELLFTIPFNDQNFFNEFRAIEKNGNVIYIKPAQYHGNPLSKDGSLVYTDFGWEILDVLREIGFLNVRVEFYWSFELGYVIPQPIFRCSK